VRRSPVALLLCVLCASVLGTCLVSCGSTPAIRPDGGNEPTVISPGNDNQPPPASGVTSGAFVFIHHSVGEAWLDDGLQTALVAKSYVSAYHDITYDTDVTPDSGRPDTLADIPGDLTDMVHWIGWFNDYLNSVKNFTGTRASGRAAGVNRIIMFKSCYPNSAIEGDGTEPGDPFDSTPTITNYRALFRHPGGPGQTYQYDGNTYRALDDIFAANPNTLFIPVTAPPECFEYADPDGARRARQFNNWLKSEWLTNYQEAHAGLNNVAVFDLFDVLANADTHATYPNQLRAEYGGDSGDSHPNSTANQAAVQQFATGASNFLDTAWGAFSASQ